MARKATAVVEPSQEQKDLVLALVTQADEPLTAKLIGAGMTGALKLNDKQLAALLDQFVSEQKLRTIPPKTGKALRYWDRGIEELAPRLLLARLDTKGPLKLADLKKAVLKDAAGLSESQFQSVFQRLQAAGRIHEHPPTTATSKTVKWGTNWPAPDDYLKKVTTELTKVVTKLAAVGVARSQLNAAGMRLLETAGLEFAVRTASVTPTATLSDDELLALMSRVEPRAASGALVTAPELRRAAKLTKADFDAVVLRAARAGRVVLHRHDFAASLSQSDRDDLVTDDMGTFYIGIGIRQASL